MNKKEMKSKNELLENMSNLKESLYDFISSLEDFERENNIDINDLITEKYPFKKDLYEQQSDITDWLYNIVEKVED